MCLNKTKKTPLEDPKMMATILDSFFAKKDKKNPHTQATKSLMCFRQLKPKEFIKHFSHFPKTVQLDSFKEVIMLHNHRSRKHRHQKEKKRQLLTLQRKTRRAKNLHKIYIKKQDKETERN